MALYVPYQLTQDISTTHHLTFNQLGSGLGSGLLRQSLAQPSHNPSKVENNRGKYAALRCGSKQSLQ